MKTQRRNNTSKFAGLEIGTIGKKLEKLVYNCMLKIDPTLHPRNPVHCKVGPQKKHTINGRFIPHVTSLHHLKDTEFYMDICTNSFVVILLAFS